MSKALKTYIILYIIFSAACTIFVYSDAFQTAAINDRNAGQVRLAEATGRLRSQLDVYRVLANIFSKDSQIIDGLNNGAINTIGEKLPNLKVTFGLAQLDITDIAGKTITSSTHRSQDYEFSSGLVQAALNGRLGYQVVVEDNKRLVRFSRVIRNNAFKALGIVILTIDVAQLEFQWPVIPEPLVFFDKSNRSVSSNRPYLWLSYRNQEPRFPISNPQKFGSTELWHYRSAEGDIMEVQILEAKIPLLEMTGAIVLTTHNARSIALLRSGLALAVLVMTALIVTIILLQRRRIALEEQHSSTLELRVEKRTSELRAAQDELVEASNLAALGRLSAGLSHELNQPLAAIMNYSENAKRFIEKVKTDQALQNLDHISQQVKRIARIINNLRAFARQEKTPTEIVDLTDIARSAIKLNTNALRSANIKIKSKIPDTPIHVRAGQIRLEQVISNLISNAIDAMQGATQKQLSISIAKSQKDVMLIIRDTGHGIKEPERVFEPFYTTKELGASKGLGMGLSLSFGLISHFGGLLTCRNLDPGAEFKITLPMEDGMESER